MSGNVIANMELPRNCEACGKPLFFRGEVINRRCDDCMMKVWNMLRTNDEKGERITAPQRVGIAKSGELVILECTFEQTSEEACRIADVLGKIRDETGIRFLMLDARHVKLARVVDCTAIQNLDELDKILSKTNEKKS